LRFAKLTFGPGAYGLVVDRCLVVARSAHELVAVYTKPRATGLLGQAADRILGVVTRRQRVLGAAENRLASPVDEALSELLRLLVGISHERGNQITEVLRTPLVTVVGVSEE